MAERLIVDHLPLVAAAVNLVLRRRRLATHIDRDDLVSAAQWGLVQAALRFRADQGASFKTYAMIRITGAIVDQMRDDAPLSRAAWKKYQAGDESVCRHFLEIGDHPELADELATPATQDNDMVVDFDYAPLTELVRRLPARESKILLLYYRDDLTMAAISERLGINESRISQLHARAIRRLRTYMGIQHG